MRRNPSGLVHFMEWLEQKPGPLMLGLGFALAALLGWIDYLAGPELSLVLFYLVPVLLAAWAGGEKAGFLFSALCAGISLWSDLLTGGASTGSLFVTIWNSAALLGVFLLFAHLFSTLRRHRQIEQQLARTDTLTGSLNNRTFYDVVKMELDRARRYRHPFAVATIDLDNFREINETFGHSIGDAVLRTVSRTISANIRTADVLARLGGDEFALLLPETGADEARALLPRLHQRIKEELDKGSWGLDVSMGATIFLSCPAHVDDIIHMADQAMYRGRNEAKRGIQITVYEEEMEV